ncbi:hypothetical protein D9M71_558380 [compost metagenome]
MLEPLLIVMVNSTGSPSSYPAGLVTEVSTWLICRVGSRTVTVGWPPVRATVRSTPVVPLGVSASGSLYRAWALFCRDLVAWLPITLLATSCRRMTKLLLPVTLSPLADDALKVRRASTPSAPSVPPWPAIPLTTTLPAKLAAKAPLPPMPLTVMIW